MFTLGERYMRAKLLISMGKSTYFDYFVTDSGLSLVQNCYRTIEHFRDTLASPNFLAKIRHTKKHNRQVYDLRYDGRHAVAALKLMQPYQVLPFTHNYFR